MDFVRTPDDRFASLPDYPFEPKYVEIAGGEGTSLRVHYVDEGPRAARPIVCLHGEPTWSFLYRKMIPHFVAAGYRAIAPDLVGFGRSDKPTDRSAYTYDRHVAWLGATLDALDPHGAILVMQDWGGLLGLRLYAERPHRFAGAVVANTFLPTGDEKPNDAFSRWRDASQAMPTFSAARVIAAACTPKASAATIAAYDAPFPDESFVAGAREFPMLVPTRPDDPASEANRAAWRVLERSEKPMLCAFSDGDPITRGAERAFTRRVPGTRGFAHATIAGASHFLQEDRPDELASAILAFLTASALTPILSRD